VSTGVVHVTSANMNILRFVSFISVQRDSDRPAAANSSEVIGLAVLLVRATWLKDMKLWA
jgi:hypothetical protein